MPRFVIITTLCLLLSGCSSEQSADDYSKRTVILPDSTEVRAEVMSHQLDMARGMMYRDSFPEGQGMLFIHGKPGRYSYWMYNVRIPLDIIWMDARGRILEIAENTPPCPSKDSQQCPSYGGAQDAMVVLELPGGSAKKHGVAVGEIIRF